MKRWRSLQLQRRLLFTLTLYMAGSIACAQGPQTQQAGELMSQRMYRDAARILGTTIDSRTDTEIGAELRMLAECHYLLGEYAEARPVEADSGTCALPAWPRRAR